MSDQETHLTGAGTLGDTVGTNLLGKNKGLNLAESESAATKLTEVAKVQTMLQRRSENEREVAV